MAGKKYTYVRNTITSQSSGSSASCHSEGAERSKNLIPGKLRGGPEDQPTH